MIVTVSIPRCGCGPKGNPLLLGGYNWGPWWFKNKNGSIYDNVLVGIGE
jgi:hypothetical protein